MIGDVAYVPVCVHHKAYVFAAVEALLGNIFSNYKNTYRPSLYVCYVLVRESKFQPPFLVCVYNGADKAI